MRKSISRCLAATLACILLAGCSIQEGNQPGQARADTVKTEIVETSELEPPPLETVTMMCNYKAVEAPNENNSMLKAIQEYTGTKLEVIWVPNDAYEEKVNTLIASTSLPQITSIRETTSAGFINATRAGMFWDLTPYIELFPNLSSIDETVMKNVQTDGRQFLIPRTRATIRAGIAIRTDWLDNLGLEMPDTIEEFHDILYAFTFDDPDGNGVHDTYGLSMYDQGLKNFATQLSIYMGGSNGWAADSAGNITSEYDSEEYKRALIWFRDCYEEGLINNDFPIVNDKTANFTNGKAGAVFLGNLEDAVTTLNSLTQVNPDATCGVLQILTDGSDGEPHIPGYQGYTGAIAIPKTAVPDEENLLSVLAFLDKMGNPEMLDLFNWGIEGETYHVVNGKVTQTEEQLSIYADKYNLIRQITPFYAYTHLESQSLTPLAQHIYDLIGSNSKYAVFDPTLPFISETETEMGGTLGELSTFINDSAIKYVISVLDEQEWEDSVQKWKDMGGAKIIKEYTEQYQAYN